jgi:hypothetical protein
VPAVGVWASGLLSQSSRGRPRGRVVRGAGALESEAVSVRAVACERLDGPQERAGRRVFDMENDSTIAAPRSQGAQVRNLCFSFYPLSSQPSYIITCFSTEAIDLHRNILY